MYWELSDAARRGDPKAADLLWSLGYATVEQGKCRLAPPPPLQPPPPSQPDAIKAESADAGVRCPSSSVHKGTRVRCCTATPPPPFMGLMGHGPGAPITPHRVQPVAAVCDVQGLRTLGAAESRPGVWVWVG